MFTNELNLNIMKHLITILFIGLIGFSVNAQDKVAKIEFKETTIDYGTIEKGADGIRVFEFTNTGDAPLIISNVKSSCGCTVPKKPDGPIAPGETAEIKVVFNSKGKKNHQEKRVTITANTDPGQTILKIIADVTPAAPAPTSPQN